LYRLQVPFTRSPADALANGAPTVQLAGKR
jgi:hypothetical protein